MHARTSTSFVSFQTVKWFFLSLTLFYNDLDRIINVFYFTKISLTILKKETKTKLFTYENTRIFLGGEKMSFYDNRDDIVF